MDFRVVFNAMQICVHLFYNIRAEKTAQHIQTRTLEQINTHTFLHALRVHVWISEYLGI